MSEKYRLYYDEPMEKKNAIGKDDPIKIEVFDVTNKEWMDTKSLISDQAAKGYEEVSLVGPFGNLVEGGKYFVKIVEELPEDED